jgi:hypothetical protein
VRLCALWDRAGDERESIPSIIELIDHPDVIEALAIETLAHWSGTGGLMNPSDDPELQAFEREEIQRINEAFGEKQAQKARDGLRKAIDDAQAISSSSRLAGIMNMRHKHLAHSLSETTAEKILGPVAPMKYGDEREILFGSLPIDQDFELRARVLFHFFTNPRRLLSWMTRAMTRASCRSMMRSFGQRLTAAS